MAIQPRLHSQRASKNQIDLADVIHHFDHNQLQQWLSKPNPQPRSYPCVARAIVEWIKNGMVEQEQPLVERLWREVI